MSTNQEITEKKKNEYEFIKEKIKKVEKSIFDYDPNPQYSSVIDYPRFEYGFQHYIHQTKEKTEELDKKYKDKKKVYRIMNPFEHKIDNYDADIEAKMNEYYFKDNSKKPKILSRAFYKLWEILKTYDLIDAKQDNFVSAHIAEGPGSFIQATMFYREVFGSKWKNDKYYAVTLHPEDEGHYVPPLEKEFINYYEKEKPERFVMHKTYTKQVAGGFKDKDNGDITDIKTINLFGGQMKSKADFVTADGGTEWGQENTQEQEAYRLIFGQILAALKVQKKGGHFVCKIFESFTRTTVKMIKILSEFYDEVELCKPYTSRPSNSEKYIICMGFKYNDSDKFYKNAIEKLEDILKESHSRQKDKLVDIFPDYKPSKEFLENVITTNILIENMNFKAINDMISFEAAQNFYGDVYQLRRQIQIEAAKYWNNKFITK